MAHTEYLIQEYRGRNYKNARTMERALAKDDNWYGSWPCTRRVTDWRQRPATHLEALSDFKRTVETYSKHGRRHRLVSRSISNWDVVADEMP